MNRKSLPLSIAESVFDALYDLPGFEEWYHTLDHVMSHKVVPCMARVIECELTDAGAVIGVPAATHWV